MTLFHPLILHFHAAKKNKKDKKIYQFSFFQVRSKSESEALNKMRLTQMNLETVRKRLSESTIKEKGII